MRFAKSAAILLCWGAPWAVQAGIPSLEWNIGWSVPNGGEDQFNAAATDPAGNTWVLTKQERSDGNGGPGASEYWSLLTYSAAGALTATRYLPDTGNNTPDLQAMAVDGAGVVFVGGYRWGDNGRADLYLARYPAGAVAPDWEQVAGTFNQRWSAQDVKLDGLGNVYVAGQAVTDGSGNSRDALIFKFTTAGAQLWSSSVNFGNRDIGYGVAIDGAGEIWLAGMTDLDFDLRPFVRKLDATGTVLFTRTITRASWINQDQGAAVAWSADDSLIAIAHGGGGIGVLKLDPATGDTVWAGATPGGFTGYDVGGMAVTTSGSVYVAAKFNNNGYSDIALATFSATLAITTESGTVVYDSGLEDGCCTSTEAPLAKVRVGLIGGTDAVIALGATGRCGIGTGASSDLFVRRYTGGDTPAWTAVYDGPAQQQVAGAAADPEGNVYVSVRSGQLPVIRKYDRTGALVWSRSFTSTVFCEPSADGIAAGPEGVTLAVSARVSTTFCCQSYNAAVFQTWDAAGVPGSRMSVTLPQTNNSDEDFRKVTYDPAGNLYAAGDLSLFNGTGSGALRALKFSPSGSLLWDRSLTMPGAREVEMIQASADAAGNLWMAATVRLGSGGGGDDPAEGWVAKYAANGTLLWARSFTGINQMGGVASPLADGYVSGFQFGQSGIIAYFLRLDAAGNEVWRRQYTGGAQPLTVFFGGVAADASGNVFASGISGTLGPKAPQEEDFILDYLLLSYDADGQLRWAETFDTGTPSDFPSAVTLWPGFTAGRVFIAGGNGAGPNLLLYEEPYAELRAALAADPPAMTPGSWVTVSLTVTNVGTIDAESVLPAIEAVSGGALVSPIDGPVPPGPVTIGTLAAQTFVWTFSANGLGVVQFSATGAGVETVTLSPRSAAASLEVAAGARLVGALWLDPNPPAAAVPGTTFTVSLTVTNTGTNTANLVTPFAQVNVAGPVILDSGPVPPGPVGLIAGAAQTFIWTYSVTGAGAVSFSFTAQGTDAVGGTPVAFAATLSAPVGYGLAVLDASLLAGDVFVGQPLTVLLTVTNSGSGSTTVMTPSISIATGASRVTYVSGPGPSAPILLPAGSATVIEWTYATLQPGPVAFTVTTGGLQPGTGAPFDVAVGDQADLLGPALQSWVQFWPMMPIVGEVVEVRYQVNNLSGTVIDAVIPAATAYLGSTLLQWEAGVAPATAQLQPWSSTLFIWSFSTTGVGDTFWSLTATGITPGNGLSVVTTATGLLQIRPGTALLSGWLGSPTSSSPLVGSAFDLIFSVANVGGTAATVYSPSLEVTQGAGFLTAVGSPVPPGPVHLDPGMSQMFIWTFTATGAGVVEFSATAPGEEVGTWVPLTAIATASVNATAPTAPLNASFTLMPGAPVAGQMFQVWLNLENAGNSTATALVPSISLSPPAGIGLYDSGPNPPGPLILSPGSGTVVKWTYSTTGPGILTLTATASGLVADTAIPSSGTVTGSIQVRAPAALAAAVAAFPSPRVAGQNFFVTLTVTNTGESDAAFTASAPFAVTGAGFAAAVAGPSPGQPVSLAGGAALTFTWTYTALSAGAVTLTTTVTAEESVFGTPISTGVVAAPALTVLSQATLVSALSVTPALQVLNQVVTVALTVTNTGDTGATGVTATVHADSGGAFVALRSGPVPATPQALASLGVQTFVWTFSVTGAGSVSFTATAAGFDAVMSTAKTTRASANLTTVAGAFLDTVLSFSPAAPSIGTWFQVNLSVSNTGAVDANFVSPWVSVNTNPAFVAQISAPSGPLTLAPGSSTVFAWTYSVSGAGAVSFTATAVGQDSVGFYDLVSAKTVVLNTKTPAALDASLSFSPGTQSVGTQVQLRLTVTNTGGAAAVNVTPQGLPQFWSGASAITYASGPVPAGPLTISAGGTTTFAWTYTVANAGTPSLTLSVTGADGGTGAPLEDGDTRTLATFNAAALLAGWTFIPPNPAVGQWFTARLTVTNTGGVNATSVSPFIQSNLGTALVGQEATPVPTAVIAPGASQTFVWTYSPVGAGLVEFTGTALGRDLGTSGVISATTTAQLTILSAASLVNATSYTPAILSSGMGFRLRLTVTNAGQAVATNVLPAVQLLNHGTATVTVWGGPTPASVPSLAGLGAQTFEWSASATAPGSLIVTLTVTGEDSNLYPILTRGTVVATVLPAAALAGAFSVQPDSAQPSVGTWVRVRLTITNTGGVAANTVTPFLDPNVNGALVSQIAAPTPLPSLAAGAMTTFEWTYSVNGAGSVAFTLTAHGRDENTAALLVTTAGGGLTSLAASQLSVGLVMSSTFPSVGQWVSVRLQVTNTGGVAAANLVPSRQIHSGFGFLSGESGPVPSGLTLLAAGGTTSFVWTYTVAGAGTVNFTGSVTASDSGTGTATRWGDNRIFTTLSPASLISSLAITPASPSVGQLTTIALTVTNAGQVHANGVTPTSLLSENIGGALFNIESPASPPGPVVIQPGQGQTFVWSYSPVGTGTIEVTGSATGTDSGVGTALLTAGTGSLVAVLPAGLKGAASFATLPVSEGQTFPVRLTVTNTGQSPASNVTPFISINTGGGFLTPVGVPGVLALLPAAASTTFEWVYTATGFGPVSFTMTAIGTDLNAGYTRTAGGTAATTILGGALLSAYSSVSSTSTSVGTWFEIRLTVTNVGGGATALSVSPYITVTSGALQLSQLSAPVLLPSLAAGAATTFAWTYSVNGSGAVAFSLTAAGTDAGSLALLTATQTGTANMLTASNLQLAFAASSTIPSVGQSVSITLTVTNTGQVHSHNVLPDLIILSGAANLTGTSGPVPAGPLTLAPGASQGFVYTATVANVGTISLTGSVSGNDAGTNAATIRNAGLLLATVPAARLGAYLALSNTAPSEGQWVQITLTVTNGGGVAANTVTPLIQFHAATATALTAGVGPTPANIGTLNPGTQTTFIWTYTAAGAGPLSFTTSISGIDSGALSTTTSRDSRAITIFRSGRLRPGIAFASSYRSVGQTVFVNMTVTNTGDQPVMNPTPFIDLNLGGATQVDAPAGIAQLDPGQTVVFTWTYTATTAGPISWTVTAIGTESVTGATIVRASTGGFNVISAATLSSTPTIVPATPSIGQLVRYRLTVMNVGGVTASAVTPFGWITAGSGLTPVSSPVNPLTLNPLASTVFEWTYTAVAAAPTNLTATAYGTDLNTSALLQTAASVTVTTLMDAQLVASLAMTPPVTPASVDQVVTITLTVTNTGGVNATSVAPAALVFNQGTPANLTIQSGPTPGTPQTITPGSKVDYVWTYQVVGADTFRLTTTASGLDAGTSAARTAIGTAVFTAVAGAQLAATSTVLETPASVGETVRVRLVVNNTAGGMAANNLTPYLQINTPAGVVTPLSSPGVMPVLTTSGAYSTTTFEWTFTVATAGAVSFTLTAIGTDAGSGSARVIARTVALTAQTAASLSSWLTVSPAALNVGQTMTVVWTVSNNGQATAQGVSRYGNLNPWPSNPAVASFTSGPTPALTQDIPGGGGASFTWQYKADAQGSVSFTVSMVGTDANSLAALNHTQVSGAINVTNIAVLSASAAVSKSTVRSGEMVEVVLTVSNGPQNIANVITPALQSANASLYTIVSAPAPFATLGVSTSTTFTWRLQTRGSGTISLTLSASGTNNIGGENLSVTAPGVSIEVQGGVQVEPNTMVIAPNLLDLTSGVGSMTLHLRGEGSAKTEVRVYDAAGQYVRSIEVALDSTGAAAFVFDGLDASGQPLASGAYWALPVGGGVEGKKPFMVKARKK